MKIINYGKQSINKRDITAVVKTLREDYLTSGPNTISFEQNFKKKVKASYAVSCSSGTSAIHLSLMALNIQKNDVVIIPVINFIASMNMLEVLGAKIILSDVSKETGQMTPNNLEECIKKNKLKKIKAVITMYNSGDPLNAEKFYKLKKKYNFYLMEDACHALGGKYYTKKVSFVGSCKFSDISTFSFHPIKSITTCEGGMITTNNKKLYEKMKLLKNHGILRKKSNKNNYFWNYKILLPGFNYRLSDVNCSLGNSQLKRLDQMISKRRDIAKLYNDKLKDFKTFINLPSQKSYNKTAFHLFLITFNLNKFKISRNEIIKKLFKSGIITQVHYIPVNNHPYYKKYRSVKLPGAAEYYKSCLSLPIFPDLKKSEINYICNKIKIIINKFKKN